MDAATLREVARVMRDSVEGEYPVTQPQAAALATTVAWARWCEGTAAVEDAKL